MVYTSIIMEKITKKVILGVLIVFVFASSVLAKGEIQDGLCKVFSGENNENLFIVEMQKDSQRGGIALQFYLDGDIEKIAWYVNGVLHGTFRSFWSDGQRKAVLDYRNGVLDGRAYQYDRNGQPQFELSYFKGLRDGMGYYYEDGVLRETVIYQQGRAFSIK